MRNWGFGDTIGCVFDPKSGKILYTMNGDPIGDPSSIFLGNEPIPKKNNICHHLAISSFGGYSRILLHMDE